MTDDRQSELAGQRVLKVGCSQVGRHPSRYFRRFSALELQQTFFSPPRVATLQRLRALAPSGFSFVVKAWQLITHEASSPSYRRLGKRLLEAPPGEYGLFRPTPAVQEAVRVTLEAAEAVGAEAVLFETPPSFAPSTQSRGRLAAFFEQIDRRGRLMVWDPRGIWTPTEAGRVCADLGLVLCTDPLESVEDRSPTLSEPVYFRISGLGRRQSLTDDDLEFLQVCLYGGSGFCILDTVEMHRDAERLLALRS